VALDHDVIATWRQVLGRRRDGKRQSREHEDGRSPDQLETNATTHQWEKSAHRGGV
jgi:hypothetical protein